MEICSDAEERKESRVRDSRAYIDVDEYREKKEQTNKAIVRIKASG